MVNESRTPFRRRNFSNRVQHRWAQYKNPQTITPGVVSIKQKQKKLKGKPIQLKVRTYLTGSTSSTRPVEPRKEPVLVPVILPQQLIRPDPEAADVVLPGLDAPPDFVRDAFAQYGPSLLHALSTVETHLEATTASVLPPSVSVTVADGVEPPTHILAAFAPKANKVTLFPVHDIVLNSHCQKLPPLGPPSEMLPAGHIPVRPFCIPHPPSYAPLSQYLYTHRQDLLFSSVCAPAKAPKLFTTTAHRSTSLSATISKEDMLAFAHELSETFTQHKLLQSIGVLHGLWKNAVALGIQDDGLWEVIDVAWGIHVTAVAVGVDGYSNGEILPTFGIEGTSS